MTQNGGIYAAQYLYSTGVANVSMGCLHVLCGGMCACKFIPI